MKDKQILSSVLLPGEKSISRSSISNKSKSIISNNSLRGMYRSSSHPSYSNFIVVAVLSLFALSCGSFTAQAMSIQSNMMSNGKQMLHSDSKIKVKDDGDADSISKSSADEMFAFSQIIASGANPMAVAADMEKELKKPKTINGISEDAAVAAYAASLNTVEAQMSPEEIAQQQKEKAEKEKAKKELESLSTNDATAAFAGLVESQVVEEKAVKFKGSAPEEEAVEETPKPKKAAPKKKTPKVAKKSSEAAQVEADINLPADGAAADASADKAAEKGGEAEAETPAPAAKPVPKPKKKITIAPKKKAAVQVKKKVAPVKKPVVKKSTVQRKKKKDEVPAEDANDASAVEEKEQPPYAAKASGESDDADASAVATASATASADADAIPAADSNAQQGADIDAQADEIINQIKQAASDVKTIHQVDEKVDDSGLLQVKSNVLLQLEDDVEVDADDQNTSPTTLAQTSADTEATEDAQEQSTAALQTEESQDKPLFTEQMVPALAQEQSSSQFSGMLNDPSSMSADEMRQYSESVANAADVVNNESIQDDQATTVAGGKKKAALAQAAQAASQQQQAESQDELQAKAAIVAQAEAANQVAIGAADVKPQPKAAAAPSAPSAPAQSAGELQQQQIDLEKQQALQFQADKQSALDQGYTEEQATQYASQEAYLANQKRKEQQDKEQAEKEQAAAQTNQAQEAAKIASDQAKEKEQENLAKAQEQAQAQVQASIQADQQAQAEAEAAAQAQAQAQAQVNAQAQVPAQPAQAVAQEISTQVQEPPPTIQQQTGSPSNLQGKQNIDKPLQGPTNKPASSVGQDHTDATHVAIQSSPASNPVVSQADDQNLAVGTESVSEQDNSHLSIQQQIQKAQEQQEAIKAALEKKRASKDSAPAAAVAQATVSPVAAQAPSPTPEDQQQQLEQAAIAKQNEIEKEALNQAQTTAQPTPAQAVAAQPATPEADKPAKQQINQVQAQAQNKAPEVKKVVAKPKVIKQDKKPVASTKPTKPAQAVQVEKKNEEKENTDMIHSAHKIEKETLQQSEDLQLKTGSQLKKEIKHNQHSSRVAQYESDLNKAREQIQHAQDDMKNIDNEVQNFHQKMAKSMHSLLKAFTEGFEAMDKAKADEENELQLEKTEKEEQRLKKFSKINTGVSNLEALTSKLKMSFSDNDDTSTTNTTLSDKKTEDKNGEQKLPHDDSLLTHAVDLGDKVKIIKPVNKTSVAQVKQDVKSQVDTKKVPDAVQSSKPQADGVSKQVKKMVPTPNINKVGKGNIGIMQSNKTALATNQTKKVVSAKKTKPIALPLHSKQMASLKKAPASKAAVKPAASKLAASKPAATKTAATKATPVKPKAPAPPVSAAQTITKDKKDNKANLKAKMQALLAGIKKNKAASAAQKKAVPAPKQIAKPGKQVQSIKKPIVSKSIHIAPKAAKPVKLVQVTSKQASAQQSDADLKSLSESELRQKLDELLSTQQKLHHISEAIAPSQDQNQKIQKVADSMGFRMTEEMKREASKMGSNKLIAHTLAERVLAQVSSGASQEDIKKDLGRTKESLQLAQKAFFDKDPEAIAFLQLSDNDDDDDDDNEVIQIEQVGKDDHGDTVPVPNSNMSQLDSNHECLQLDQSATITNPAENEEEIQAMIDKQK